MASLGARPGGFLDVIIMHYYILYCDTNTQETTKEIKCCQPVMTNEGPALDSRALAQDLTKVSLSLP